VACPMREVGSSKEAGSLGQVRQEPLNPCRETLREQAIARPRSSSPVSLSGSGEVCWLLFDILRCATFLNGVFPSQPIEISQ